MNNSNAQGGDHILKKLVQRDTNAASAEVVQDVAAQAWKPRGSGAIAACKMLSDAAARFLDKCRLTIVDDNGQEACSDKARFLRMRNAVAANSDQARVLPVRPGTIRRTGGNQDAPDLPVEQLIWNRVREAQAAESGSGTQSARRNKPSTPIEAQSLFSGTPGDVPTTVPIGEAATSPDGSSQEPTRTMMADIIAKEMDLSSAERADVQRLAEYVLDGDFHALCDELQSYTNPAERLSRLRGLGELLDRLGVDSEIQPPGRDDDLEGLWIPIGRNQYLYLPSRNGSARTVEFNEAGEMVPGDDNPAAAMQMIQDTIRNHLSLRVSTNTGQ